MVLTLPSATFIALGVHIFIAMERPLCKAKIPTSPNQNVQGYSGLVSESARAWLHPLNLWLKFRFFFLCGFGGYWFSEIASNQPTKSNSKLLSLFNSNSKKKNVGL